MACATLWHQDSDSDSSSSSDSDDEGPAQGVKKGRDFWLKKVTVEVKRERKQRPKVEGEKVEAVKVQKKKEIFSVAEDISEAELNRKILETVSQRGRRNVDARDLIRTLGALSQAARKFGPQCEVPALGHLIASHLDTQRNMDDFLVLDDWRKCHGNMMRIVEVLEADERLRIEPASPDDLADMILAQQSGLAPLTDADREKTEEATAAAKKSGVIKMMGNLYSLVARLDEEYTKALQKIDPHTDEYIERLRMEAQLVRLARLVQKYYERAGNAAVAAQVALVCIEHVYYKHDSIAHAVAKAQAFTEKFGAYGDLHPGCLGGASAAAKVDAATTHPAAAQGTPSVEYEAEDVSGLIETLCSTLIYKHGDPRVRTRAMLCHIGHHALHDRFYEARDLLLMSHLADNITATDVSTQILFNRTMVMLGLCAFRAGLIWDAHHCLNDVCSGRVKELLAQGVQGGRYSDKNPEQEKAERRRQIPYHMHINQDLMEACYVISAMLLEVPNMVTEETSDRPRHTFRNFRRHMENMDRQVFVGPPENTRDHVMMAARSLKTGDWRKCALLLLDDLEAVWALIPGEGVAAALVGQCSLNSGLHGCPPACFQRLEVKYLYSTDSIN